MMKKLAILLLIPFVFGCNDAKNIISTDIKDILNDPHNYKDKPVIISGRVTDAFNVGLKYYQVKDKTGEIYVIPKDIVSNIGDDVILTGRVEQYFKIGNSKLTVIEEYDIN